MSYEIVKRNFDRGLWDAVTVKIYVKLRVITAEQFEEITGQKYEG
jgi:hypothetical protein